MVMMEKDREVESLPEGVVTMLLTGYVKTIENQHRLLLLTVVGWVTTTLGFTAYIFFNR